MPAWPTIHVMGCNDVIRQIRLWGLAGLAATVAFCISGCGGAPEAAPSPTQARPRHLEAQAGTDAPTSPGPAAEPISTEKLAYMAFQAARAKQLRTGRVQRNLTLTAEQLTAIGPALKQWKDLPDLFRALDPEKRTDRLFDDVLPMAEQLDQTLANVLMDKQAEQLFRIVLKEQQGVIVLLFPGVRRALGLSDQQQADIEAIVRENFQSIEKADIGWADAPRMIETARRSRALAFSYLTDEQRQRWEQLLNGR